MEAHSDRYQHGLRNKRREELPSRVGQAHHDRHFVPRTPNSAYESDLTHIMQSRTRNKSATLLHERASLAGHGKTAWRVRQRAGQSLSAQNDSAVFDGLGGLTIHVTRNEKGRPFSYVRGKFVLNADDCIGELEVSLELSLHSAPGVFVLFGLFEDPDYRNERVVLTRKLYDSNSTQKVQFRLDVGNVGSHGETLYAFVQVCLETREGAEISIGEIRATSIQRYRKLRVRFDFFGDESKASSRLRGRKYIELLRREGHEVFVGKQVANLDLYFCQKVRPFSAVNEIRQHSPQAVIVYDFDDNFLLPDRGTLHEVLAFFNNVDMVSCGSEYLANIASRWHQNVFVLENPVDIVFDGIHRAPGGNLDKIGWFGSPEGLGELGQVDLNERVVTITRGGDIEFDLRSIDRDLVDFDLLLFPLSITPWNLAKNANRMLKAIALGVPVLASATPEQRRMHELLDLHDACLVEPGADWKSSLEQVRKNYREVELATVRAREKVLALYSPEAILSSLFKHLGGTTRFGRAVPAISRRTSSCLSKISVVCVESSNSSKIVEALGRSCIDWRGFQSIGLFSIHNVLNDISGFGLENTFIYEGSFLDVFASADKFVDETSVEYVLVLPNGTGLAVGIIDALDEGIASAAPVTVFARSAYGTSKLIGSFGAYPLQEAMAETVEFGPVLVKVDWLRAQNIYWSHTFGLWTWVVALRAMSTGAVTNLIDLPLAFETADRGSSDAAGQYAAWLGRNRPEVASELPGVSKQWGRMLVDVIADAVKHAANDLPRAYAELYARHHVLARRLEAVQQEIKSLKLRRNDARETAAGIVDIDGL